MNEFLEQRIKAKEASLAKLSRQMIELRKSKAEIEAELRAYKDVLLHLTSPGAEFPPIDDEEDVKNASTRISDTWKDILTQIAAAYPDAISVDGVKMIIKKLDKDVSDLTLRSQLSLYKGRGWLSNVGIGLYRITEKGAAAIGFPLPEADETDLGL